MNNQVPPKVNIDMSQTTEECCEKCGNKTFKQIYYMRKLSALLSPIGQETMIPLQAFACDKCGHVNKGFLPKEGQ